MNDLVADRFAMIAGRASSPGRLGGLRGALHTPAGHAGAGELLVIVACNRRECRGEWRVKPGQQLPPSCPRCGKFDW